MARLSIVQIEQDIRTLVSQINNKLRENIDPDTRAADLRALRSTLSRRQKQRRAFWKKTYGDSRPRGE